MLARINEAPQDIAERHGASTAIYRAPLATRRGAIASAMIMMGLWTILLAPNAAHAATCADELRKLGKEWDAISYPDPAKPGQPRVIGRGGRENTGAQVMYMKTEIRLAHIDCKEGRNDEALARVHIVRRLLRLPS